MKILLGHIRMSLQLCYYIEVAHPLDTDSFLLTLRRFIGRRGNIRQMRSDEGSNFAEAVKELRKSFQNMNHSRINEYLQMHGAEWITWISNTPTASHMGQIWERQIRRARSLVVSDLRSETKGSRFESGCQLCAEVSSLQQSPG